MQIFSALWNGLQEGLAAILHLYASLLEPLAGEYRWGLSIILLTLTVRLFLVPLAVRQTKSMRAMQQLQPELKKIQKKYEVDKSLMKTDPERYKAAKEKQREAQMALYQEHNVNPVGGCLPLILQMPIFFALFRVLQPGADADALIPELTGAGFFGIGSLTSTAGETLAVGAIFLVVLQVATTYYSSKQMQGRNSNAAAEQQQAQKIMLYVMPAFLGYLSWTFPIGVVLYWVTTNFWTIGQQYVIFRNVEAQEAQAEEARKAARQEARAKRRQAEQAGGSTGSGKSGKSGGGKTGGSPKADANGQGGKPKSKGGTRQNGAKANGAPKNGRSNGSGKSTPKGQKAKPTD